LTDFVPGSPEGLAALSTGVEKMAADRKKVQRRKIASAEESEAQRREKGEVPGLCWKKNSKPHSSEKKKKSAEEEEISEGQES